MKLYVVVRKDLSSSQQAVQAGHAVAEYLINNKNSKWKNHTLIYLGVDDESSLKEVIHKLNKTNVRYNKFIEPDIGDQITAIASDESSSVFKRLKLL